MLTVDYSKLNIVMFALTKRIAVCTVNRAFEIICTACLDDNNDDD